MSQKWSKFDEKGLARYVTPESIRWVRLPLNRTELADSPRGRKQLAEAIYTVLLGRGIRYTPEKYHPEPAEQQIRSTSEILDAPGEGTCLDLATFFAGLCLGFELIPILIVTEKHALCAVSLTHGLRDWDAFDRRDRQTFEEPLADPAILAALVDDETLLAIECTGFAHSETLGADAVEGTGRHNGILPFTQAVQAGRAQIERAESPLRFAIDIAVAHYEWKISPPELPADYRLATEELVADQLASGLRLQKESAKDTVASISRPVTPLLGPPRHFVDRLSELDGLKAGMRSGRRVWLTGVDGIGKTTLLRRLTGEDLPDLPDGAVYLDRSLDPEDAAQQVWESFFEADRSYVPSRVRIGRDLRGTKSLIMLDGASPGTVERLADLVPESSIVATAATSGRGEGTVIGLEGLAGDDAVAVFEWHLGRQLTADERISVKQLCDALGGHPARIADAARAIADGHTTLDQTLAMARASADAPSLQRMAGLSDAEQQVETLLKAFQETGLHRRHIEALVPREPARAISRLVAAGAIATGSPRYHLAATAAGDTIDAGRLDAARSQAVEYFAAWVSRATPAEVAESLEEIQLAMRWALAKEGHAAVVKLGMAAESAAALTRRWGTWRSILETTLESARTVGDRAVEAHTLHQLGTRARLLGDRSAARRMLKKARRIRRGLGDTAGADLSKHNLGFARSALVPVLVGTAIVVGVGGGAAALCATTDICSASGPGVVEVEPSELDFGEIPAGGGATEEVRVVNSGGSPAALSDYFMDQEEAFTVAGSDCPSTLEPGGECTIAVSFAPPEPGTYSANLTVQAGTGPIRIGLLGVAVEPADVRIDPGIGEFGAVAVGDERSLTFDVLNTGGETARIVAGPEVDGDFFAVGATDCGGEVGAGESCAIEVTFRPDRDPGEGAEEQINTGVLAVETDAVGLIEVPLNATSTFRLADLTIEIRDPEPIGRPPSEPDVVAVRVVYMIQNRGEEVASGFAVSALHRGEDVPFVASPEEVTDDISGVFLDVPLGPGEELEATGYVLVPRDGLDPRDSQPVQLMVDSCAGRDLAETCSVIETSEENNASNEVDSNRLVGHLEVDLERMSGEFEGYDAAFVETPMADLVADALKWTADRMAEEAGFETPVTFIDAGTLIPPTDVDGREFIEAGDLTVYDLVDIAPWGVPVVANPVDSGAIAEIFQEAVFSRGSMALPQIPDGSQVDLGCFDSIWNLILADRGIISTGGPIAGIPLPTFTTMRMVDGTYGFGLDGFEPLPGEPMMVELLETYVTDALGGLITEDGLAGQRWQDVCIK